MLKVSRPKKGGGSSKQQMRKASDVLKIFKGGYYMKKLFKDENGAAMMVEAAIIYPVVFLLIVVLIYMGLYILQIATLSGYAQKIAIIASREVALPGYSSLTKMNGADNVFSTGAVEGDLGDDDSFNGHIALSFNSGEVKTLAYRYWSSDPLGDRAGIYEATLNKLVEKNSIIGSGGNVTTEISCDNYFITQYVKVKVTQPLVDFPILEFFGIDTPTVSVSVQASVNDVDELVRNTDFAVDAIKQLALRLGINIDEMKGKLDKILHDWGVL